MKKREEDGAMAIRLAAKNAGGGGRARRSSRPRQAVARGGGLRRASRWFFMGLGIVYVLAIVWSSLAYAYAGGDGGSDGGTVGSRAGASVDAAVRPLRVIYRSGSSGSRFGGPAGPPLGAAAWRLSPLGVRAYVQRAAREAGVSPNEAEWIVAHESSHRPYVTGDGGESRGLWQISRIYHPEVSDRCAYDVKCSTAWSLRRILGGNSNEWSTWKYRDRLVGNHSFW